MHDRAASSTSSDASARRCLYENNPYGRGLAENFQAELRAATIVSIDPIGEDSDADASSPTSRWFKQQKPDVVFVAGTDASGLAFLKEARRQNLDADLVGGDGWQTVAPSPLAEGVYVGAPFSAQDSRPEVRAFVTAYSEKIQLDSRRQRGARLRRHEAARPRGRAGRTRPRQDPRLPREPDREHRVPRRDRSDPLQRRRRSHWQEHRHDARARRRHAGGGGQVRLARARRNSTRFAAASGSDSASSSPSCCSPASRRRSARSPGCRQRSSRRSPRSKRKRRSRARSRPTWRRQSRRRRATSTPRDSTAQSAFSEFGWAAHDVQRQMNEPPEPVGVGSRGRSRRSTTSCRRWRSTTRSRTVSSTSAAATTRGSRRATRGTRSTICSADIALLGRSRPRKSPRRGPISRRRPSRRADVLLSIIGLALVFGIIIVMFTVRRISEPLEVLVHHAQRLSDGDLASRTQRLDAGRVQHPRLGDEPDRRIVVAARQRGGAHGGRGLQLGARPRVGVGADLALGEPDGERDDRSFTRRRGAGAAASLRRRHASGDPRGGDRRQDSARTKSPIWRTASKAPPRRSASRSIGRSAFSST